MITASLTQLDAGNAGLLNERFVALRRVVVTALVNRGYPYQDAEDATQDVLEKIAARPARFADKIAALEEHEGYFVRMAVNAYLMRLRSERRRREREKRHFHSTAPLAAGGPGQRPEDLLDIVAVAPLSELQRRYLHEILVGQRSVEQIAAINGTTARAVRGVLQRAATIVRNKYREDG
jgi:DNA-directed RNA polymerase specialized sigma24 family protein